MCTSSSGLERNVTWSRCIRLPTICRKPLSSRRYGSHISCKIHRKYIECNVPLGANKENRRNELERFQSRSFEEYEKFAQKNSQINVGSSLYNLQSSFEKYTIFASPRSLSYIIHPIPRTRTLPALPNASSICPVNRLIFRDALPHFAKIFAFSLDVVKLCFAQSGAKQRTQGKVEKETRTTRDKRHALVGGYRLISVLNAG